MTTVTANAAFVTGSDGVSPIYNPEGRFQIFSLPELWQGINGPGAGRYVPNVNDLVADTLNQTASRFWRVVSLDSNLVPRLVPWGDTSSLILNDGDVLTGPGRSQGNNTHRVYLDTTVTPHVLAVDKRLSYKGSESSYVKITRSTEVASAPKVISGFYDAQGKLLGQDVPLELVGVDAKTNRNEWCVPVCYTSEEMPDNEIVTVVAYSAAGHVVSRTELLVVNTSFVRSRNLSTKYITGVSLNTPFLSETVPKQINLPVNVPLQGLYMQGRVDYSDGSFVNLPVDGTRFTVLGLQDYVATRLDQKIPITLRYLLSDNEVVYGSQKGQFAHKSETYTVLTQPSQGAYNIRLYGYPEWVSPTDGYRMRWWLYNTDRNIRQDVTSLVRNAENMRAFDGMLYGAAQTLSVQLDMAQVNPVFQNYRHTQTQTIALLRQGTERQTNWTIAFDPGQNPLFGDNNFASLMFINANFWKVNLKGSYANREAWLEGLYKRIIPQYDSLRELEAPLPTHYRLRVGATVQTIAIDQWDQTISVINGLQPNNTLYIEWIRKTPETELELGITGVPLYPVTNL